LRENGRKFFLRGKEKVQKFGFHHSPQRTVSTILLLTLSLVVDFVNIRTTLECASHGLTFGRENLTTTTLLFSERFLRELVQSKTRDDE
jgi:hypothetical protein